MDEGEIKYLGTYNDLIQNVEFEHVTEILNRIKNENINHDKNQENLILDEVEDEDFSFYNKESSRLTLDEDDEKIDITIDTYKKIFYNNGSWKLYVYLIPIFFAQAYFMIYATYYQAKWVEDQTQHNYWYYFAMCLIYPFNACAIISIKYLIIFMTMINKTKILHENIITKVLNASINLFFDKTPSGVILNRLSKDINKVDDAMPDHISSCLSQLVCAAFTIYIAVMNSIFALILVPFILIACYAIMKYYMNTYQEVSRLQSVTCTPVINHLSETCDGVSSIRAFQKENVFMKKFYSLLDNQANSHFWMISLNSWIAIRVEFISMGILIFTSIMCIVYKSSVDPIWVGIMFSHFLWMTADILYSLKNFTEFQSDLVSFERCNKLLHIPQEKQDESNCDIEEFKGEIEFKDFSLRYRPETELILHKLNFSINPKEKIGIVGRTGSGKSTICNAILRIVEGSEGKILIDGIDISEIDLNSLRSNIAVIPQDSAIFEGTLRCNIDPTERLLDEEILEVIHSSSLDTLLRRDPLGLDQRIEEMGKNLSCGEKQLICICRAILKRCKIVILDEATANIDMQTEQKIQDTINKNFADCTVITIAHRLSTIINSDKVLVLDKGKVVEFDDPQSLLSDPNSYFSSYISKVKGKINS